MQRPVIIVDPMSSGSELASTFKAKQVPSVAVSSKPPSRMGFGQQLIESDFIDIVPIQDQLEDVLRKYNPIGVLPGTESGVPLADRLCAALTPEMSNVPAKSLSRLHKAHMQKALVEAGVPAIETLDASSVEDVELWLREKTLLDTPLILKPPIASGSDKVFHIPKGGDWKQALHRILSEPCWMTGKKSETAVVQEEAIGTEYAVGTVSAHGKHYLSHIIKYNKSSAGDRKTVFDHVEFVPFERETHGDLFEYTKRSLDALGIRWGAAHNEIMLTKKGPRLIETGARMLGGPTVSFSREATGSSQADKLAEAYVDGDVQTKQYTFKKTVVPVFLRSLREGVISNAEALEDILKLPSLYEKHIWFKNGDKVPQTVDYLTSIGIIALSGDREQIFRDYTKIREMESRLQVS
jgi:biotin carboxylase